jgi:large subunit ribosomal protein L21
MFAIIQTGGKQYKITLGEKIRIEKLDTDKGGDISFEKVLMVADGDNVKVGTPFVVGAKVEAKVLEQGRDKKKIVFKYHAKTRYRKKHGHRQPFTEVEIVKIIS